MWSGHEVGMCQVRRGLVLGVLLPSCLTHMRLYLTPHWDVHQTNVVFHWNASSPHSHLGCTFPSCFVFSPVLGVIVIQIALNIVLDFPDFLFLFLNHCSEGWLSFPPLLSQGQSASAGIWKCLLLLGF